MKKSLLAVMLTGLFALVSLPALGNVNLEQLKQKLKVEKLKAQLELGYRYFQGNETTKDLTGRWTGFAVPQSRDTPRQNMYWGYAI